MNHAFLSLGSNIGNREEYILKAIDALNNTEGVEIIRSSSNYETEAEPDKRLPPFINAAVEIITTLNPRNLLTATQEIEKDLGRTSKNDNASRTIDIDIALYNDKLIDEEGLTIPHPLMHKRIFVLEPIAEISPETKHPIFEESIQDMLYDLKGCDKKYS